MSAQVIAFIQGGGEGASSSDGKMDNSLHAFRVLEDVRLEVRAPAVTARRRPPTRKSPGRARTPKPKRGSRPSASVWSTPQPTRSDAEGPAASREPESIDFDHVVSCSSDEEAASELSMLLPETPGLVYVFDHGSGDQSLTRTQFGRAILHSMASRVVSFSDEAGDDDCIVRISAGCGAGLGPVDTDDSEGDFIEGTSDAMEAFEQAEARAQGGDAGFTYWLSVEVEDSAGDSKCHMFRVSQAFGFPGLIQGDSLVVTRVFSQGPPGFAGIPAQGVDYLQRVVTLAHSAASPAPQTPVQTSRDVMSTVEDQDDETEDEAEKEARWKAAESAYRVYTLEKRLRVAMAAERQEELLLDRVQFVTEQRDAFMSSLRDAQDSLNAARDEIDTQKQRADTATALAAEQERAARGLEQQVSSLEAQLARQRERSDSTLAELREMCQRKTKAVAEGKAGAARAEKLLNDAVKRHEENAREMDEKHEQQFARVRATLKRQAEEHRTKLEQLTSRFKVEMLLLRSKQQEATRKISKVTALEAENTALKRTIASLRRRLGGVDMSPAPAVTPARNVVEKGIDQLLESCERMNRRLDADSQALDDVVMSLVMGDEEDDTEPQQQEPAPVRRANRGGRSRKQKATARRRASRQAAEPVPEPVPEPEQPVRAARRNRRKSTASKPSRAKAPERSRKAAEASDGARRSSRSTRNTASMNEDVMNEKVNARALRAKKKPKRKEAKKDRKRAPRQNPAPTLVESLMKQAAEEADRAPRANSVKRTLKERQAPTAAPAATRPSTSKTSARAEAAAPSKGKENAVSESKRAEGGRTKTAGRKRARKLFNPADFQFSFSARAGGQAKKKKKALSAKTQQSADFFRKIVFNASK